MTVTATKNRKSTEGPISEPVQDESVRIEPEKGRSGKAPRAKRPPKALRIHRVTMAAAAAVGGAVKKTHYCESGKVARSVAAEMLGEAKVRVLDVQSGDPTGLDVTTEQIRIPGIDSAKLIWLLQGGDARELLHEPWCREASVVECVQIRRGAPGADGTVRLEICRTVSRRVRP